MTWAQRATKTFVLRLVDSALMPLLALVLGQGISAAEKLQLTAVETGARARWNGVQLSSDGKSLELVRGLLIEDDGAAAGYSYRPNEEPLSDGTTAIKWLQIPEDARDIDKVNAYLLVGHTGKTLRATINGVPTELGTSEKVGNYWKKYPVPSSSLKAGSNEIRLTGDGKIWIARTDDLFAPRSPEQDQRSAKLTVGSSKPSPKLGPANDILGEYCVRLYLDGYFKHGFVELPTLQITHLTPSRIYPHEALVLQINLVATGEWLGKEPRVGVYQPAKRGEDVVAWASESRESDRMYLFGRDQFTLRKLRDLPSRFEFHVTMQPTEPTKSPRLTAVRVGTDIHEDDLQKGRYQIIAQNNPFALLNIFRFEPLNHPRLTALREKYKLDEVVKGCTTDLERMQKLAAWSSQQWTKGHLKDIYPKWDALEILKLHEDGTPVGGFCQQYNIVFLQACQSLGMVGRCVSIGAGDHGVNIRSGHEVVEIWSNEHNKWVYVDGQAAWYFVDQKTRTPLNLLELRERQIAALRDKPHRAVEVVVLAKSPYEWKGLKEWPAFCELRMIPHTRFLDGKLPIPLNQGMRGWFWTGHRVWTDDLMPASILYDKRITNPRDWNFTVNQTQFWLTQREKEGELDVKLAHNMPSFSHFVVKFGDAEERIVKEDDVVWPLMKGENRFQVQAVNVRGVRGPASWARVKYE